MGMGMNFMGTWLQPMGDAVGMGIKLMGMGWGRGNVYGDVVGLATVYRVGGGR